MSDRMGIGTPFEEPKGFWARVWWWFSGRYQRLEHWERDQKVRAEQARLIAADLREEFPRSDIPNYIEREFGDPDALPSSRRDPEEDR